MERRGMSRRENERQRERGVNGKKGYEEKRK